MKNGLYAYAYYHYMRNNGTSEIFRAFIAGPREYSDSHKKSPGAVNHMRFTAVQGIQQAGLMARRLTGRKTADLSAGMQSVSDQSVHPPQAKRLKLFQCGVR